MGELIGTICVISFMYLIGMLSYSYIMMQAVLTVTYSIPLLKFMNEKDFDKKRALIYSYGIIVFYSLVFIAVTCAIFYFGNSYVDAGYFLGITVTFFISTKHWKSPDNMQDFKKKYLHFVKNKDEENIIDDGKFYAVQYCKKCGSPIDRKTKKCKGCGKQYLSTKKVMNVTCIAVIIIAITYLGFIAFSLYQDYTSVSKEYNELVSLYEELQSQSEQLNMENEDLIKKIDKFNSSSNTAHSNDATSFIDLKSRLRNASTGNKYATTASEIYSVKKGESKNIHVNFKAANEIYMSWSNECIDAKWEDNTTDVKITGNEPGIVSMTFSTDENGNNSFYIVILCYE